MLKFQHLIPILRWLQLGYMLKFQHSFGYKMVTTWLQEKLGKKLKMLYNIYILCLFS